MMPTLLNADPDRPARVHAAEQPWESSPQPGVSRRYLHRVGGEVAQATTLVRYEPGSHFHSHVHDGGEEFLVLAGTFEDEHGRYPAGSYVRNPPGSQHTPGAPQGCTLFVKLRQFQPGDQTPVRLLPGQAPALVSLHAPGEAPVQGVQLHRHGDEDVRLETWLPGQAFDRPLPQGAEILVLSGHFLQAGEVFGPLSWLRLPRSARLQAEAGPQGAQVWIKLGGLPVPPDGALRAPIEPIQPNNR